MSLLVIAEPELAAADRRWIDGLRAAHDPRHALVAPHFTLVFPAAEIAEDVLASHVRRVVATRPRIAVCLRAAQVAKDAAGGAHLVYLVPDEGLSALVLLHDRLYAGPLAPYLRLDLPFVPHVTVARSDTAAAAKALADRINRKGVAIRATIAALDIVRLDGTTLTLRRRFELRPR